ncbi:MAG: hypothetical protein ACNA7Q_08470 [Rhodobacterales bacterium]
MSGAAQTVERTRRGAWHLQRQGDVLVLSRRVPARFDLSASALLMTGGRRIGRARMAHQLRQDMWRCLQGVRGFWPVVRIEHREDALQVTAGGGLDNVLPQSAKSRAEGMLAAVLEDPAHQARWLRHAVVKAAGGGA